MKQNNFYDLITENDISQDIQNLIKKELKSILLNDLYLPLKDILRYNKLIKEINDKTIYNSNTDILARALIENKIYFNDGLIQGDFNAILSNQIANLGGIWDNKLSGFKINLYNLPKNLLSIIQQKEIDKKNTKSFLIVSIPFITNKIIDKINKIDLDYSISNLFDIVNNKMKKKDIIISDNLIDIQSYKEKYTENMQLSIKKMTEQQIYKLRTDTLNILETGGNTQDIQEILNKNYNLTKSRTEFIANQEVRLALTNYQEEKFNQKGFTKFYWVHTQPNNPNKRHEHFEWFKESNNGRIFDYRNLPINPTTGKIDAPGRAYNCHCIARIIIDN